ncbi:MAG TPA: hypothetical protein VM409_02635, partial [Chloroflexia bacterium]|nr:hypothetical protein [Chloroflexia bacterium]
GLPAVEAEATGVLMADGVGVAVDAGIGASQPASARTARRSRYKVGRTVCRALDGLTAARGEVCLRAAQGRSSIGGLRG